MQKRKRAARSSSTQTTKQKTPKKITVGRQRICSERTIKLIDPVWIPGPVPSGFWNDRANRRNYMLWLGHRLGYRRMEDWYRLKSKHFRRHRGHRVLNAYWSRSRIQALQECFPQYDWQPWRFAMTTPGFWHSRKNQLRYMEWLGQRLGYRRPSDWYAVKEADFNDNFGATLLQRHSSPAETVMKVFPRRTWYPWLFNRAPTGFWDHAENRRAYVLWLGRQLKIRRPTDWYRVTRADFRDHRGGTLLARYAPVDLLEEALPELDWGKRRKKDLSEEQILGWADEYFRVHRKWPNHYSGQIAGTTETWCGVNQALLRGYRGLPGGRTLAQLLGERRGARNRRTLPQLSEEQILAWADAHFKHHRRWPTASPDPIDGTDETWRRVSRALHEGLRGLPGGSSLSKLLWKHRQVREYHGPRLKVRQILRWADTYFRRHKRWPCTTSGAIDDTEETWARIDDALRAGYRGLPGGSSLPKLLKKHGLV